MSKLSSGEISTLKHEHPCDQVAGQWVRLRHGSNKFGANGFTGPCPLHSPDPQARDSTRFECGAEGWVCVECGGGDVFRLVALRHGLDPEKDFRKAVELLAGKRVPNADEVAAAARAREKPIENETARNEWRDRERERAYDLYYKYAIPLWDPAAEVGRRYLREIRKVDFPDRVRLRFDPECRYYVQDRPSARLIHTGPAILGMFQRDGKFAGTHMTFIDLDAPKGKAVIVDTKNLDAALSCKKMRGSKAGSFIDLTGCQDPGELVMGEGTEKELAVWTAYAAAGRDLAKTAFWSAMDLGNLGGKHADRLPHPTLKTATSRVQGVPGPSPDMTAPAIAIPPSVSRLVLLGDSTSDRFSTQCVLARAAKRYARPGLEIVAAWSPDGKDFDDLFREAA